MKKLFLLCALLSPVTALAQSQGIDFTAMQRGRAAADAENWRNIQRMQELERARQAQAAGLPAPRTDEGAFELAYSTGEQRTGDSFITRCNYQTSGGFRFAINSRSSCPFSVEVDPISGRVRTQ